MGWHATTKQVTLHFEGFWVSSTMATRPGYSYMLLMGHPQMPAGVCELGLSGHLYMCAEVCGLDMCISAWEMPGHTKSCLHKVPAKLGLP